MPLLYGGGGQGSGHPGEEGLGLYWRQEKEGWEVGFPEWREPVEIKIFCKLRNVLQKAQKRSKRYRSRKFLSFCLHSMYTTWKLEELETLYQDLLASLQSMVELNENLHMQSFF